MRGIYGGHPIDRWLEARLNKHLDEQEREEEDEEEEERWEWRKADWQAQEMADRESYR